MLFYELMNSFLDPYVIAINFNLLVQNYVL
jgi:hypothetical protein